MSNTEPMVQECPSCTTVLDVAELEPFAEIRCPICGAAVRVRTVFDNFTLVELLGKGGMGSVFRATDANLQRAVALKIVRREFSQDQEFIDRFENEAKITASVNHPHVVKVFSFGSAQGLYYIAMELVDKGSLDDLMNLQKRVAESQALEIGQQIAEGLQAAHRAGLVHRDVKPGNILFADAHTAKIVDFGLAILQEREAAGKEEVWGTPYYVCPERLDHQPEDCRSDIYSLGATLFHAIAGRPPFEAETASMVALKHLQSHAVSLQAFAPEVSGATAFAINRMLQRDPEQRYQNYDELLEHLQFARDEVAAEGAKPKHGRERVVVESEEHQKAMFLPIIGMIGALLVVIGLVLIFGGGGMFEGKAGDARTLAQEQAANQAQTRYDEGRRLLIAGDAGKALAAFAAVGDVAKVPQPLRNWILLHRGLCAAIAGQGDAARQAFTALEQGAIYSNDDKHLKLGNFFAEAARLSLGNELIPPRAVANYNLRGVEALYPLLFGVKDWNAGDQEAGRALLVKFLQVTPQPPYDWIADYKTVAARYLDRPPRTPATGGSGVGAPR